MYRCCQLTWVSLCVEELSSAFSQTPSQQMVWKGIIITEPMLGVKKRKSSVSVSFQFWGLIVVLCFRLQRMRNSLTLRFVLCVSCCQMCGRLLSGRWQADWTLEMWVHSYLSHSPASSCSVTHTHNNYSITWKKTVSETSQKQYSIIRVISQVSGKQRCSYANTVYTVYSCIPVTSRSVLSDQTCFICSGWSHKCEVASRVSFLPLPGCLSKWSFIQSGFLSAGEVWWLPAWNRR